MSLNNHHFGIFIGLSLAMHAVVLTVMLPDYNTLVTEQNTGNMDVELLAKKKSGAESKRQPARPEVNHNRQKNTPVIPQTPVAENNITETESQNSPEPASLSSSATQNSIAAGLIRQKIAIEFSRYFYYPDAARRRNWQGDVVLQFNLLPDGHLDQIRIHQSSGYTSLDEAAVHALQQVKPQLELASLTDAGILQILPVSYRLTNPL